MSVVETVLNILSVSQLSGVLIEWLKMPLCAPILRKSLKTVKYVFASQISLSSQLIESIKFMTKNKIRAFE
jgi:hypothetical protein